MALEDSLFRRCRDQEIAIAGLMDDRQQLREENADLLAQLELARRPFAVADAIDRLEATLPAGPAAPATARAALTRWLSGDLPIDVLEDARLLASELVASSLLRPDISEDDLLRLKVECRRGALRVEVRVPGTNDVVAPRQPSLQLVDRIAARWGIDRTSDTNVWFEVESAGATD
jgi:hypothetical protein